MATGQQVKDNQWRQGSFLPPEMVRSLAAAHSCDGATHALIITQDCDITHGDLEVEPYAEILFLWPLADINPGLVDGKSSRILHLEAFQKTDHVCFEAQPWNRARIPRENLAKTLPDTSMSLNQGTLKGLIQWVADRYTRTAFPDTFVDRIYTIKAPLERLLKKEGRAFWRLLVAVDPPAEVDENQDYVMECICVVWPEFWDDAAKRTEVERAGANLKKLLEGCKGIKIDTFEVDTADEMPLSYLFRYRPWDVFNFLSHRDLLKEDGYKA